VANRWQQLCGNEGDCSRDCRILSVEESAEVDKLIESNDGIHVCPECHEPVHYIDVTDEEVAEIETAQAVRSQGSV